MSEQTNWMFELSSVPFFPAEFRHFNSDLAAISMQQEIRLLVQLQRAGGKHRRGPPGFLQIVGFQLFLAILLERELVIFPWAELKSKSSCRTTSLRPRLRRRHFAKSLRMASTNLSPCSVLR